MLVACLVYASAAGSPIGRVVIVDESGIQAFSEAGKLLWLKSIGVPIAVAKLFSSEGSGQLVVVGLSRDLKGKGGGDILLFDRQGRQLWRFRMGHSTPYPELSSVHMGVKHVLVADVLPHPGTEVVVTVSCSWYPTRVCVLGEDGQLLREMWHPGVLSGVMPLGNPTRLIFWGCNNGLGYQYEPDRPEKHYYASGIFCIEADKIAGQCPPTGAPSIPVAPTLWYRILSPKGCTFETIRSKPVPDSPDPLIEVWTTTGWLLVLDVKGNIISRSRSDSYEGPPCGLNDIHDVLGAKQDER